MKIEDEELSITIVSDFINDIKGALCLIYSISKNTDIKKINILSDQVKTNKNVKKVLSLIEKLDLESNFINVSKEIDEISEIKKGLLNFKSLDHISNMAYAKILIFVKVPEKTIYLDTDTLIIRKLAKKTLLKKPEGYYFVINGNHSPTYWFSRYEGIFKNKKEVSQKAFNSGVFLKNTSNKKENTKIYNDLYKSIKVNNFTYLDQAHFNYVFKNKAKYLDLKYNWPVHNSHKSIVKKEKSPLILHFASKNKPWDNKRSKGKQKKIWLKYWENVKTDNEKRL